MAAERLVADLCVIGAGSGGLSVAAGAAQLGASVVLVERDRMGGDCLNTGCVPSKALIAAAAAAHAHRRSAPFGTPSDAPEPDYAAAMAHVARAIAAIAPKDSVERFEGLGVRVIRAHARFTGPAEVEAGGVRIAARRFVVATGSTPVVPPIPGLDRVPFFTSDTIWENRERPGRLVVIGGGPIGVELAQAHGRLGSRVEIVEMERLLPREDPELAAVVARALAAEGIVVHEGAAVTEVARGAEGIELRLADGRGLTASHLLVATGRRPVTDGLGLDRAGVEHDGSGIRVDRCLRSVSNRRVYAVGDVAGGPQFTHVAGYHAGLVVRHALFRLPVRVRTDHIPRVTYTDPELAQVGLAEAEARARHGERVEVVREALARNDRAVAEGRSEGMVKLVIGPRGRLLGCGIVAPHAGELVHPWALALARGLPLRALADYVAPYPTLGEAGQAAARAHFAPRVFANPWLRRLRALLARLG